jgi:hypothetical protein
MMFRKVTGMVAELGSPGQQQRIKSPDPPLDFFFYSKGISIGFQEEDAVKAGCPRRASRFLSTYTRT